MRRSLIVVCGLLCLMGCSQIADNRVDQLRELTERVERRGERFTEKEWKEVYLEYKQLDADFQDLDLTEEQADSVYYIKQRFERACTGAVVRGLLPDWIE